MRVLSSPIPLYSGLMFTNAIALEGLEGHVNIHAEGQKEEHTHTHTRGGEG